MSKDQGRRATESSGPLMDVDEDGADGGKIGGDSFVERTKNPSWLKDRWAVYDTINARRQKEFESKKLVNISVTMPDGNTLSHYKPKKKKVDTSPITVHLSQNRAQRVFDLKKHKAFDNSMPGIGSDHTGGHN